MTTLEEIDEVQGKLAPCPICGGKVGLVVTDDEGNFRGCPDKSIDMDRDMMEEYLANPWSGVSVTLHHFDKEHEDCPLFTSYPSEESWLGGLLFDDPKELLEKWNNRVGLNSKKPLDKYETIC